MSPNAYAKHRGVSRMAVQQAITSGRVTEAAAKFDGKRWLIDPTLADAEWEKNTRRRRGVNENAEDRAALGAPDVPSRIAGHDESRVRDLAANPLQFGANDIPVDEDGKPLPPVLVAAIKTAIEAQIKQLELSKLRGSLVPAELAEKRLAHCARMVRDAILSVPSRIAHQIASETDAAQVEIMLERELVGALVGLNPSEVRA